MKPLSDLDHYEVLEVAPGTPPEAIERAYLLARATYADDSLAGYSVFEPGDALAMRERIETAYRVLGDARTRAAYDAELRARGAGSAARAAASQPAPVEPEPIEEMAEVEPVEAFDEESDHYDGSRLRRSRLRRGLEIEDVAKVTKVNPTYLRFLEDERFADLPARVYVRGFLMAYAGCVGLDPDAAARSYLEAFDAATAEPARRFRGA